MYILATACLVIGLLYILIIPVYLGKKIDELRKVVRKINNKDVFYITNEKVRIRLFFNNHVAVNFPEGKKEYTNPAMSKDVKKEDIPNKVTDLFDIGGVKTVRVENEHTIYVWYYHNKISKVEFEDFLDKVVRHKIFHPMILG